MLENPYQRYRQVQLETASPLELIIKLYDGALRFIQSAQKGLADKDYQGVNRDIQRAERIVEELDNNLNLEAGEVAENLRELYRFINRTLVEANIRKDPAKLETATELLRSLRESWVQLRKEQKVAAQ